MQTVWALQPECQDLCHHLRPEKASEVEAVLVTVPGHDVAMIQATRETDTDENQSLKCHPTRPHRTCVIGK